MNQEENIMVRHKVYQLKETEVVEIKGRLLRGESILPIAKDYRVIPKVIRFIYEGKAWERVPPSMKHRHRRRGLRQALSPVEVEEAKDLYSQGLTKMDLCYHFVISLNTLNLALAS